MRKSQPDDTHPLPDTAELGGEGGSFGDSASRRSPHIDGAAVDPVDEAVTDILGNATRFPEVKRDTASEASQDLKKYPTES